MKTGTVKLIFRLIVIIIIAIFLIEIFGKNSIVTNYYFENVLFSPYNIVGVILLILSCFGIWLGKKTSSKLFHIVASIMTISSFLSIFGYNIWYFIGGSLNRLFKTFIIIVAIIILLIIVIIIITATINYCLNKKEKDINIGKPLSSIQVQLTSNKRITSVNDKPVMSYDEKLSKRICPKCGSKIVSRQNSYDGTWFFGCSQYPNCCFTEDYRIVKDADRKYEE